MNTVMYNGKEYELARVNSDYAVIRDGRTALVVSAADLVAVEEKPKGRKKKEKE